MKNIDIDIDMVILENIDIDIDITMYFLENIDIDKEILKKIDIDKKLYRFEFGISNSTNWSHCQYTNQWDTNLEKAVVRAWREVAGKTNMVVQAPKVFHLCHCCTSIFAIACPSSFSYYNLTVATVRMGLWFSSQVRALSFLKNHKVQAFWT